MPPEDTQLTPGEILLQEAKKSADKLLVHAEETARRLIISTKETINEAVKSAVKETVNGKIDGMRAELKIHNEKHEKEMERVMPVILAFEEGQNDLRVARKGGRIVLWLAATITALGGAWLVGVHFVQSLRY